jgi:predicted metal-dependent hydrolase
MPTTTREGEITLGGEAIEYELSHRASVSQPRIDIDIRGVVIVLPEGSDVDAEAFLHDNAAWVLEKTQKYEQFREAAPERIFEVGETFPYLGEEYELTVETRPKAAVEDGAIRLRRNAVEQSSIKRALENFYRRSARDHFEARADRFASVMGLTYEKIEVRNQRTKWGSCSTSGTLGLNWRLMMAPPEIIDYIVVHELAHLRESKHTREFWMIVSEYHPEYRQHAEWLEENSSELIFSLDDL